MTSISHSGLVETRAAPKAKVRNASIDRKRTFLTLVVLIHHAVIPYTYFGHTDAKSSRCIETLFQRNAGPWIVLKRMQ